MSHKPNDIIARVRELREILDLSQEEVAEKLGIALDTYRQYETGQQSIPISTLNAVAELFHVDFTVLLTGDMPRMENYSLVRKGEGVKVERFPGYGFQSLAYNFKNRSMEPLLVTLEEHDDDDEPPLVSHGGQEFNLVLEGKIKIVLGKHEFELGEGDSFYFDPRIPHGQRAIGGPAKFVTIINN
ncbi:MAG: helix-turn-helix transcriptional regulator [Lentisphaerae bacterium]|jgi:transcriptional regulator with XRE-family HTH domain|nr:helix-turn-helix transcriptional regulator [Lentisphaerota bacterium]